MLPIGSGATVALPCALIECYRDFVRIGATRVIRVVVFIFIAVGMAGCGLVARQKEAERVAAINQQVKDAVASCQATYSELPKDAIVRARCFNDADKIHRQIATYPDLVDLRMAKRMEVAERIARREKSLAYKASSS